MAHDPARPGHITDAPAVAVSHRDARLTPGKVAQVETHLQAAHVRRPSWHSDSTSSDSQLAATTRPEPPYLSASSLHQHVVSSSSNSQESSLSLGEPADQATFTTPPSDMSAANDSQESALSQVVAAQELMAEGPSSRKRMADGAVKQPGRSSASPVRRHGHSRNTSSVSMASTRGSRIGELSAELKARLSYAMVKVNHGWQSNTIDEVESLASHAVSPSTTTTTTTSSNSTIHGRNRASTSPALPLHRVLAEERAAMNKKPATTTVTSTSTITPSNVPTLAPPAPIQPARTTGNLRRNSGHRYTPSLPTTHSPSTPASTTGTVVSPRENAVDPILFSPHQNVREQEVIETLLFMSSPGNSANMKHAFSPSTHQPATGTRHALPSSQPRRTLPSQRPQQQTGTSNSNSNSNSGGGGGNKRVNFHRSPGGFSDMEVDSPRMDSPGSAAGTPRRRGAPMVTVPQGARTPLVALSAGLGGGHRQRHARPVLRDDEIERMLDGAGAASESSDDDEIAIPIARRGAGMVGT